MIYEMGVIDLKDKKHPVYFKEGLNIVTGASSTGKSALIEIFDYCLASSEDTIPEGIITDYAQIYYVCIVISDQIYVFGRKPNQNKIYTRTLNEYKPEVINAEFFEDKYAISKFKEYMRNEILNIDSIENSREAAYYKGKNESRPTIRSFMSLILQHQNLIANKHALFYRFDEKEKREQVINHAKFFLGFVEQEFYILTKEKEAIEKEIKNLEKNREVLEDYRKTQQAQLEPAVISMYALMGFDKDPVKIESILTHPSDSKDRLDEILHPDKYNSTSDMFHNRYQVVKNLYTEKTLELNQARNKTASIRHSLNQEQELLNSEQLINQEDIAVCESNCPFCNTRQRELPKSAKFLQEAIEKLNQTLKVTEKMQAPLQTLLSDTENNIKNLIKEVKNLQIEKRQLEEVDEVLKKRKEIADVIYREKYRLFNIIDVLNPVADTSSEEKLQELKNDLRGIEVKLKKYNFREKVEDANEKINEYMSLIGQEFNFEESYGQVNLKFSLESFDLYQYDIERDRKIYLRSMGSGANWLYSHLTLFMALHKYFVSLNEKCLIPSILFLDQPTQVYFPNFQRDHSKEGFLKEEITALEGFNEEKMGEDMLAVTNIFDQLNNYCKDTKEEFGFSPQIIVTDHVDGLKLENDDFEELVNGNRWRGRGLIELYPVEQG